MSIRFYVDADLIGLGKLLVQVRSDVTYAGDPGGTGVSRRQRPPCPISYNMTDAEWISIAAGKGWIVITRDRHMISRPAELAAIKANSARHVRIDASHHSLTKWEQLEVVVSQWRRIEQLTSVPGPWIYVVTRSGVRQEL